MSGHAPGLLAEAVAYLAAVVLLVPLFTRFGLGAVLGYLAAGIPDRPLGARAGAGPGRPPHSWPSSASCCCCSSSDWS